MSASLFALSCPECGGPLALDHLGTTGTCVPCQHSYLNRFGHLIPTEFHEPDVEQNVLPAPLA